MGLDTVELVMKIEKTFGIQIPDPDAERLFTVGAMHNYIWGRVQQKETDRCKSQSLFYRLRIAACNSLNIPREDFTIDASLNELIPFENRRVFYKELAGKTGLVFPDLELEGTPAYIFGAIGWIMIAGGLATALALHIFFDWTAWIYLMPVAAIYLTIKLNGLFEPYKTRVAPPLVREFTEKVLMINYAVFAKEGVSRKEVESMINNVIADHSGLELSEITPEKSFTNDLGLD